MAVCSSCDGSGVQEGTIGETDERDSTAEIRSFLRRLSHELTTPLSAAVAQVSHLQRAAHTKLHEEDSRRLTDLRENLDYLRALVLDTHYFLGDQQLTARYDFSNKTDLRVIIERVVRLLTQEARLNREIAIRNLVSRTPPLYLDALRMEQVFFNLLQNAVKYSDRGAHDIMVEYDHSADATTETPTEPFHRFTIKNWGIGVPQGEEHLIFEEYTRGSNAAYASPSGTGLGLVVSRRIVEGHGGKLQLTRRANPTTFSILLPSYLQHEEPRA